MARRPIKVTVRLDEHENLELQNFLSANGFRTLGDFVRSIVSQQNDLGIVSPHSVDRIFKQLLKTHELLIVLRNIGASPTTVDETLANLNKSLRSLGRVKRRTKG